MKKVIPHLVGSLFSVFTIGCTSERNQIESSKEMHGFHKGTSLSQGLQGQAWCLEPTRNKTAVFRRDGSLYVRTIVGQDNPSIVEQSEYFWRTATDSEASLGADALFISDDETHWNRYPLTVMLLRTGETRVAINGESWISCEQGSVSSVHTSTSIPNSDPDRI